MITSRMLLYSQEKKLHFSVPLGKFMHHSDRSAPSLRPGCPAVLCIVDLPLHCTFPESMGYGKLIILRLSSERQGPHYKKTQYPVNSHLLQPTFQTLPEPQSTEGRCHRLVKTPRTPASETGVI